MTVLLGDTGKVAYGTFKTTNITLPNLRENPALGLTLPTTEPGTPQISYTVQDSDLATFSGTVPMSVKNVPILYVSGRVGASSTTINYRLSVNGTSKVQSNNANAAASSYFTYSFAKYIPVSVGDVVTVSLWSNQTDTSIVYSAFSTNPTRLQLSKGTTILKDVAYGAIITPPSPTQAPTPTTIQSTGSCAIYPSTTISLSLNIGAACVFPALVQETTNGYYLLRCSNADQFDQVLIVTHATNQFTYYRNNFPSSISFREVLR